MAEPDGIIRSEGDIERGLAALLRLDPALAPVAAEAGPLPLRLMEPGFAGLAHIVTSQMVSRASATAIWQRMVASAPLSAEAYAARTPDYWLACGLSRAKAETLQRIASAELSGRLDLEALAVRPFAEAMEALTALPGIGPWTAEVYLMFCAGHADVFPAGDVALQNAVQAAFGLDRRPDAASLRDRSACWSPWRSVAARLFWAYYAHKLGRGLVPSG